MFFHDISQLIRELIFEYLQSGALQVNFVIYDGTHYCSCPHTDPRVGRPAGVGVFVCEMKAHATNNDWQHRKQQHEDADDSHGQLQMFHHFRLLAASPASKRHQWAAKGIFEW